LKKTLLVAVGVLLYSVSAAEATPIRGTFTGVVTAVWSYDPNYPPLPVGTPAWAIFGYDSAYLSSPDEFGSRFTSEREGYEGFFYGWIGDTSWGAGFSTGPYGSGSLLIGPNGLPFYGNGAGPYDSYVFPNGFRLTTIDYSAYVDVEGTYSLPDHEATLPLMVLGLAALAVARRFL
jgi:hypothetical protein